MPELEQLLADHERLLEPDAFGTLVMRVRVAQVHEKAGNLAHALELHMHATAEMVRVQGADHANVERSRAREDVVRAALGLPTLWDQEPEKEDGTVPTATPTPPTPVAAPTPKPPSAPTISGHEHQASPVGKRRFSWLRRSRG
ncbi:hypothetical protein ACFQ9X_29755 [Catenulispora yoronensis]